MNKEQLLSLIKLMGEQIEKNKIYLTKLDADIGDGDHGINMARGFSSIVKFLDEHNDLSISDIFENSGRILFSISAGTSGPLYGVTFKAGGKVCLGKEEIGISELIQILEIGIAKIKVFGDAQLGDKTMLDAMIPCLETLKESTKAPKEALIDAYNAAIKGRDSVINLKARKGRASYLGERAIGHIDPGSESFCLIFKTICDFLNCR